MFLDEPKKRSDLVGKQAEDFACEYLINSGYKILRRNFLCALGEIDIIAEKDNRIFIVEVKFRSGDSFDKGRFTILKDKERALKNAGIMFMKRYVREDKAMQFDLIEIDGNYNITHLKAIF